MIEILKQMYQLLLTEPHAPAVCDQLEVILRQAIAELESQEPVAYYNQDKVLCFSAEPKEGYKPVYTPPPQRTWVGLTDEEIQDAGRFSYCRGGTSEKLYHIMWNSQPSACIGWSREELIAFTKAVEAKYQEKNQ